MVASWGVAAAPGAGRPAGQLVGRITRLLFHVISNARRFVARALAAAFSVMGYYAFAAPGGLNAWWNAGAWGVLPLFVLFGLAPFLMWGFIYRRHSDPDISLPLAFALGMANWAYGYLRRPRRGGPSPGGPQSPRLEEDGPHKVHLSADRNAHRLPGPGGGLHATAGPRPVGPAPADPHRRLVNPTATARFVFRPSSSQSAPSLLPTSPAPAGTSSQPNHRRIPALVSSEAS